MGGKHVALFTSITTVALEMSSLIRRRQFKAAVRLGERVTTDDHAVFGAPFHLDYGIALEATGNTGEALLQFEQARTRPGFNLLSENAALCTLALVMAENGHFPRAGEILARAGKLVRGSGCGLARTYRYHGRVATLKADFYAAVYWHEKAARRYATDPAADPHETADNAFERLRALACKRDDRSRVLGDVLSSPFTGHDRQRLARLYRLGPLGVRYGDWLQRTARIGSPYSEHSRFG